MSETIRPENHPIPPTKINRKRNPEFIKRIEQRKIDKNLQGKYGGCTNCPYCDFNDSGESSDGLQNFVYTDTSDDDIK